MHGRMDINGAGACIKLTLNPYHYVNSLGVTTTSVNMSLSACHSYRIQATSACDKEVTLT